MSGSRTRLFRIRNFRLWWGAESFAVLGDTATFIALQWALLSVYDELIAGLALALAGIPRAGFMLFGGILTDRYSPRDIVIASNLARAVVIAGLSAVLFTASHLLPVILTLTFLFGTADAFFYPAQGAFLPRIVPRDLLASGNAMVHGTMQVGRFVGPAAAGALITWAAFALAPASADESIQDAVGSAAVLALVSVFLVIAAIIASLIRSSEEEPDDDHEGANRPPTTILHDLGDGLRYAWRDRLLRIMIPLIFVINILLAGIFTIGLASYVKSYLGLQAADFGILISSMGAGSLIGIILAGTLPHPERPGALFMTLASAVGLGLIGMLFVDNIFAAMAIIGVTSIANGYVNIMFITWLQLRTPREYLGRVMSLINLASIGGEPLSQAATGMLLRWSIWWTFIVAGSLQAVVLFSSVFSPTIRKMEYDARSRGE